MTPKPHRIIVTRGLPAAGKSTWSRTKLAEEPGVYKIIEKDALRLLLDGGVWSKANEKFVLKMRDRFYSVFGKEELETCK